MHLHDVEDGRSYAVVDNVLENPDALVDFAIQRASQFTMLPGPPGPRLLLGEELLDDLHRLVRSKLARHFPIFRSGIKLRACLSNVTLAPAELTKLQRMCHIDRRQSLTGRTYAGLIYLFRNPDLGGTGLYRWNKPNLIQEAEKLFEEDPEASMRYLNEETDYFNEPPQYMTSSNDIADLLAVIPAKYNRLVFYNGEEPHSGHITHPELLTDDLSKGRLTFNFFADVRPQ